MVWLCVLAVLLFLPATAAAQKTAFIQALVDFHSALAGTYGDEGARVEAAFDRMATALEAWNTANRAAAARRSGPVSDPAALARLLAETGRPDDVLGAVDAAIRLEPGRAGLHMLRGVLLDAAGREADARGSFERAWALDPADPVNVYLLADRMATDQPPEPPERQLASLLRTVAPGGRGTSTRTAPFINAALIDDSASGEPRFALAAYAGGYAALMSHRYEEAIDLFKAAMAADPLIADQVARSGRAAHGLAALREGRNSEAVADLEAAVAAAPSSSEACRLLGVAHAVAGHVDASLKWLAEAVRLAPRDERALGATWRVLIDAGRIEEAERVLRGAIRVLPASGRARWALAELYEKTGRGIEAIDQLEQAAALPMIAGKAALLWRLADLAHQLQDEERSVSALARRTRLLPNDPLAHRSLGLAYHRAGRDVQALIELLLASHLGLEDVETLAVMGQIHLNAGRLPMAEAVLRRAVSLAPDSAPARYALARTLLGMGKTPEGQQELAAFQRLQEGLLEQRRQKYESDLQKRDERLSSGEARK